MNDGSIVLVATLFVGLVLTVCAAYTVSTMIAHVESLARLKRECDDLHRNYRERLARIQKHRKHASMATPRPASTPEGQINVDILDDDGNVETSADEMNLARQAA